MNDFIRLLPSGVLTGVGLLIPLLIQDALTDQSQSIKALSLIAYVSSVWIGFLFNTEYGIYITYNTIATLITLLILTLISILSIQYIKSRGNLISMYTISAILMLLSFASSNLTALSGKILFILPSETQSLILKTATSKAINVNTKPTITMKSKAYVISEADFEHITAVIPDGQELDKPRIQYNLEPRAGGRYWEHTK